MSDSDPVQMQPGPIRHESLPAEMLEQIRSIYDVLGRYFNMTFEEFELGFKRDETPEIEVDLWMSVTAAWIAYHEDYLDDELLPDDEERKLISALIAISTGIEDVSKLGVSVEVGQELLECYCNLGSDEEATEVE